VLTVIRQSGRKLADLAAEMSKFPQTLVNVRVSGKPDLESSSIKASVQSVERELGDSGRVVLRASGTEPVVRVMVEGEDAVQVETLAGQIADAVGSAAA
jgi:phosphoglucosamine mutase